MEDIELKALSGLPVEVEGVGVIRPLKAIEVADIGKSIYDSYVNSLCFDVGDLDIDKEIDGYDEITTFDILLMNCTQSPEFHYKVTSALSTFFGELVLFFSQTDESGRRYTFFHIGDYRDGRIIHRENYEDIKNILKIQNNIVKSEEEEYNPGNETARKLIEKIKNSRKNAPPPKHRADFHSMISGVAWKGGIGINDAWQLTIYQLYDAYYRLSVVDQYDNTMRGVYAGTVDSSKIDIKEVNWSNIIKLN